MNSESNDSEFIWCHDGGWLTTHYSQNIDEKDSLAELNLH